MSEHHAEIIIIKRKGGHEDGHHGGAWKIAFADFMTAMMAFFLVLWIINATDKDTKTVIARYFNPVKLENPARARKGVHGVDPTRSSATRPTGDQAPGAEPGPPKPAAKDEQGEPRRRRQAAAEEGREAETPARRRIPSRPTPVDVKPTMSETALFSDPYQSARQDRRRARGALALGGARHRHERSHARSRRGHRRRVPRSLQAGRPGRRDRSGLARCRHAAAAHARAEAGSRAAEGRHGQAAVGRRRPRSPSRPDSSPIRRRRRRPGRTSRKPPLPSPPPALPPPPLPPPSPPRRRRREAPPPLRPVRPRRRRRAWRRARRN